MIVRKPTVFVVDDDDAVRESLDTLLSSVGLAVETFSSADDFLAFYTGEQPGCLVLDIRMRGMSGLELQQELRHRALNIPVIIITGHGDVPVAIKALKNGAVEFLQKPFSKQLLLEHINRAIEQDRCQRDADTLRREIGAKLEQLTPRENDVMLGILAGKLSKQIASELGVSKKTVDVHRGNLMRKMGVDTVATLVEQVLLVRQSENETSPRVASADLAAT